MTTHPAHAILATTRADLRTHEAQAERTIEVAFARALQSIRPHIDEIVEIIEAQQANGVDVAISPMEKRVLHSIIASHLDHFAAVAQHTVAQQQQIGAHLGRASAQQLLQASVPEGVHWTFRVVEK